MIWVRLISLKKLLQGVSLGESGLNAVTPRFTIDRTQWNVMFHAGVLGTAKDEIINDLLGLQIQLVAKP